MILLYFCVCGARLRWWWSSHLISLELLSVIYRIVPVTAHLLDEFGTRRTARISSFSVTFKFNSLLITQEVEECGCYFIAGQARGKLDWCPGVSLGEFIPFSSKDY